MAPHELTFGVNVGWMTRGEALPAPAARAAEQAGFDVVTAADHVGSSSPFVVLAAAAAVTERVRLRTYVLDVGFWNPGLLARDVATLDVVSGGRVELGLGLGHMRHEHEAVGLPFPSYGDRLAALQPFADAVRARLADDAVAPRPVQTPVPVLAGSMSRRGLEVAVRTADVVALTGILQAPGRPPGTFRLCSSAQFDERVGWVRELRDSLARPHTPLDMLMQRVELDRDPEEAATALLADDPDPDGTTVGDLLDSPAYLFARTVGDAAAELVRRSERWGIGSWCVHQPSLDPMARVIAAMRS